MNTHLHLFKHIIFFSIMCTSINSIQSADLTHRTIDTYWLTEILTFTAYHGECSYTDIKNLGFVNKLCAEKILKPLTIHRFTDFNAAFPKTSDCSFINGLKGAYVSKNDNNTLTYGVISYMGPRLAHCTLDQPKTNAFTQIDPFFIGDTAWFIQENAQDANSASLYYGLNAHTAKPTQMAYLFHKMNNNIIPSGHVEKYFHQLHKYLLTTAPKQLITKSDKKFYTFLTQYFPNTTTDCSAIIIDCDNASSLSIQDKEVLHSFYPEDMIFSSDVYRSIDGLNVHASGSYDVAHFLYAASNSKRGAARCLAYLYKQHIKTTFTVQHYGEFSISPITDSISFTRNSFLKKRITIVPQSETDSLLEFFNKKNAFVKRPYSHGANLKSVANELFSPSRYEFTCVPKQTQFPEFCIIIDTLKNKTICIKLTRNEKGVAKPELLL